MRILRKLAIVDVLVMGNFRNLWLAQVFSQSAINVLTFVLAFLVYSLTHRNTAVSVLVLMFAVPQFLIGALAGVFVDRYDRKMVLLLCNLTRAIAVLGFLVTGESVFGIYLLAIVISVISQFFVPAEAPTIPTLVSGKELLIANGVFTLTIFSTMLAGGLLAGPFLDALGLRATIVLITAMFFLAAVFIAKLPGQAVVDFVRRKLRSFNLRAVAVSLDHQLAAGVRAEFVEGVKFLRANQNVRTALILLVISQTIVASMSTLLPGFADQVLHIPVNDASVMLIGPAIAGIIVGAVVVSQVGNRFPRGGIINLGLVLIGLFLVLLGVDNRLLFAQLTLFGLGFANAFVDVSSNTTLQEGTTEEVRSRVYGLLASLGGGLFILPVIGSGLLSDTFGVDKVFLGAGSLILISASARILSARKLK